eukprot:gnl/TRDRNA2_/TRDRNA2_125390_c0_seq2.p1 gnl/TRDRNA2_/TRDRNA2_125390_c0~~gnl/TRDRNA2_/TRDRNA2_125390_c0_seq2.p1  ORF type:complete len:266 (-),score=23.59 gnl/TRDRNA2_/TRDRNA2_125390_c0_seq2:50-826(-)
MGVVRSLALACHAVIVAALVVPSLSSQADEHDCRTLSLWVLNDIASALTAGFRYAAAMGDCPIPISLVCHSGAQLCTPWRKEKGIPATCEWTLLIVNMSKVAQTRFAANLDHYNCERDSTLFCSTDAASAFSCRLVKRFDPPSRVIAASRWVPLAAVIGFTGVGLVLVCLLAYADAGPTAHRPGAHEKSTKLSWGARKEHSMTEVGVAAHNAGAETVNYDSWDLHARVFLQTNSGAPMLPPDQASIAPRDWGGQHWDA